MEAGIRVEGLIKRFPRSRDLLQVLRRPFRRDPVTALTGVNLVLEPGRVHGLVGPNGAGKTTLLKALAGLILPDQGRIRIAGLDPEREPELVRARVGFVVADERSFFARLSVRENLRFFAALRGLENEEGRGRIQSCLRTMRLESIADATYQTLSSGMRQRLAIARALLSSPPVLLLDEPTRSLDPPSAASIWRLLREMIAADPGRLILCSSHDLGAIQEVCDHVVLMRGGGVVGQSDVGDQDEFLLQTRQAVPAALRAALGLDAPLDGGATRFAVRASGEELDRLVDGLRRAGLGLQRLQPGSRSLRALFDVPEAP